MLFLHPLYFSPSRPWALLQALNAAVSGGGAQYVADARAAASVWPVVRDLWLDPRSTRQRVRLTPCLFV